MVMLGVDEDSVFKRLTFRTVARFALSVVSMSSKEKRVLGTQVEECREVERSLELMLVAVTLAVGLRGRDAWKEGLHVLPTALWAVGMVGTGAEGQIVLALHLERRPPNMLVASGTHLLAHSGASALTSETAHGMYHFPSWLVAHAAEGHDGICVAQAHSVELSAIVPAGISCCLDTAIPVIHESRLDSHVEHLLLIAVCHARSFFLFTLALISFHVCYSLHG